MKCIIFLCMGICVMTTLNAQLLKGKVKNEKHESIPGATLYVQEKALGCVVDENGEFQLELPLGTYTCEFSALGYEKQIRQMTILMGENRLVVQLTPQVYMLPEVRVTRNTEDPAYFIMRHAIACAPFHQHQVKQYTAEIYTKGTMQLHKMPKMLMWSKEIKKEVTPYLGKVFLLESLTELYFETPATYNRKIMAFSSTIPDEMDPGEALDIMAASIYEPDVMGLISPLAPGAFSYYRFYFEDCYAENGRTISKIRVEPRKENRQLVKGWLYIAENDWSVVNFKLIVKPTACTVNIAAVFHEVKPSVFLPTSYDIDVKVKFMGIEAGGKYYSSVKYKAIEAVEKLPLPAKNNRGQIEELSQKVGKRTKKENLKEKKKKEELEKLIAKEELTTREAYRVARLSREMVKPESSDTVSPLQIKEIKVQEKVSVDSLATRRDSLYWIQIRTIPLRKEEKESYQQKDSIREVVKNLRNDQDTLSHRHKKGIGNIGLGDNIRLRKGVYLKFAGLLGLVPEYNFVDGFWIGQKLKLSIYGKNKRTWKIMPALYFATARKTLLWEVKGQYTYAPLRHGNLNIGIGYVSTDYKRNTGTWRLENTLTSLVCADNFMKFYSNRYIRFQHDIDLMNGLRLSAGGYYENRKPLVNHISYNFCKKDPKPNTPVIEGGVAMPANTSLSWGLQLDYTPYLYYRIEGGEKRYIRSSWPTFSVRYQQGIPTGTVYSGSFAQLSAGIRQNVGLGIYDRISYRVSVGKFLSDKEIYFPDYKHFYTTGWVFDQDNFAGGFFIADYYELATRKKWVNGAFNYRSEYLLLKRLPFMQRLLFNEAVHFRYLWIPEMKNYVETGYSLGVGNTLRAGVFFGFDRKGYQGTGIRVSFSVNR